MSGPCGRGCDPEAVFELADRGLDPNREREVLAHIERCPGCWKLYERELDLNNYLGSLEFPQVRQQSVCPGVVIALPTRPAKVRMMWALLAGALLVAALLALHLNGENPVGPALAAVGWFREIVVGIWDVARTVLELAGPVVLGALVLGALADLAIAAAVLAVSRRRAREV